MTNEKVVRTRFAPSPTGFLHVGGARTALFAWLYARHCGGQFILRIEDTDRERSTEESVQAILDGMQWLGLDYDEGPFYQTQRFDRYNEVIQQLLDEGKAYRCYCSKERLEVLREDQLKAKQKPRYDGRCRNLDRSDVDEPHVIRFRNPDQGDVTFNDLIRGPITVNNDELDDLIIARTDGTPTYNFTVVVDDSDMAISHVIRGDDHINNTPRQINLLTALGANIPEYAHVPMILGSDGKRLSKRHGAVGVMQYQQDGFLPEALLNYLVRLGWANQDQEVFSRQEMIDLFDLTDVNRSASSFNPGKLLWLNQHYLKELPAAQIEPALKNQFSLAGIDVNDGPSLIDVLNQQASRCKTLVEVVEKSIYFYQDFDQFDEKAARKNLKPEFTDALKEVLSRFEAMEDWQPDPLHQVVIDVAEQFDLKLGKLAQAVRVSLTGNTVSPPLDTTICLIGKAQVVSRLKRAVDYIVASV